LTPYRLVGTVWEYQEGKAMTERTMSRRTILEAGVPALVAAAGARASEETETRSKNQEMIRKYYAAWDTKDWHAIDMLLAEDFTFSSPLDDHIRKSDFKAKCWDAQIAFIDRFDLKHVIGTGNEAFVMYVCHTANAKTLRNVEYFQLRDDKVRAVECYFGGKSSFPSAVSTGST
jgi:ketosteroid isomerase-like protein